MEGLKKCKETEYVYTLSRPRIEFSNLLNMRQGPRNIACDYSSQAKHNLYRPSSRIRQVNVTSVRPRCGDGVMNLLDPNSAKEQQERKEVPKEDTLVVTSQCRTSLCTPAPPHPQGY